MRSFFSRFQNYYFAREPVGRRSVDFCNISATGSGMMYSVLSIPGICQCFNPLYVVILVIWSILGETKLRTHIILQIRHCVCHSKCWSRRFVHDTSKCTNPLNVQIGIIIRHYYSASTQQTQFSALAERDAERAMKAIAAVHMNKVFQFISTGRWNEQIIKRLNKMNDDRHKQMKSKFTELLYRKCNTFTFAP